MPKFWDITNRRFGRLVVCKKAFSAKNGVHWHCKCDCGNRITVTTSHLVQLHTRSCGCWKREKLSRMMRKIRAQCTPENQPHLKHGHFVNGKMTSAYNRWNSMIQRCTNPNRRSFKDYGGRGITVCKRWRDSFEAFLDDMGEPPSGTTLDRKNNDGPYNKRNCRWATPTQQEHNKQRHRSKR